MKRYMIALMLLVAAYATSPAMGAVAQKETFGQRVKHALGFDDEAKPAAHAGYEGSRVDTVAFWTEAVNLFDKAGYGADSEFGKHARANLQRVETLRAHRGAGLGAAAGALATAGLATRRGGSAYRARDSRGRFTANPDTRRTRSTRRVTTTRGNREFTQREREAFKKGRKAGEAHERRVLKRKAEGKKLTRAKRKPKTEVAVA